MSHEILIRELLEDPDKVAYRPEVRRPEFFEDYIRYCLGIVDSDPVQGLPKVDIGLRIATSSCQTARLWGLKAFGIRVLGDPKAALVFLEAAFRIAGSCLPCQAYLLWRRAKVYAALGLYQPALTDAGRAVELYHELNAAAYPDDHDLHGNGLANSIIGRGVVRGFIAGRTKTARLITEAIGDFTEALDSADPREYPVIFRVALFNLAKALAATGKLQDLKLADSHLSKARVLFRGPRKRVCLERAKLDWLTGMVRHELGNCAPCRVRKMLDRALEDFLYLQFYKEASAVVSDLSKIYFPETDPIIVLTESVMPRLRRFTTDLAGKVQAVSDAAGREITSLSGGTWTVQAVQVALKAAIEDLRLACGAGMLACVLNWRSA